MIDAARLLSETKALARDLVDDLRDHADAETVDAEYRRAKEAGRTALSRAQWAEGLYAQVAVAWVLGCVFVRFCEDNGLVPDALLSGPGNRREMAREQRAAYLQAHPAHDDRDWLRSVFERYRALPATGDIFGDHNPLWLLAPSADTGQLAHDFTDPAWGTRFLGDLYQDLSEHAKKQYALLQTPVFVEEFILDRTLDPAIKTFGLRDTDLIDPTCGSGHFLLGAFDRLFERWLDTEPGTNRRELARRALDQVAGVDINPFAVAIARFRLLVAALRAGGDTRLADAPTYPINVAVGDSLLHGVTTGRLDVDDFAGAAAHGYATEDLATAKALLSREWAAVVGNPPYITVKDPALNALYRMRYETCHRQYSLGVPFTERFWQLARHGRGEPERAGYIGMITANSFMKREFGKKLIETWMPAHDLTTLIDTSGAYIPGHGTPTVILFGRARRPVESTVRAVMGIRGEPSTPTDPAKGLVWTSITDHLDHPGAETEFVSVVDMERERLHSHPWSIGGGGAADLKELLDQQQKSLAGRIKEIGRTTHTGEDEAYLLEPGAERRLKLASHTVELVIGEAVRDWGLGSGAPIVFPYDPNSAKPVADDVAVQHHLWSTRTPLRTRLNFGQTNEERGLHWWEYTMFFPDRYRTALSITFAFVGTHNHFVLDRGGKVFNRSAPVIKLPEGASEDEHLDLLGVLNSSTACFWMKQVFHNKGSTVDAKGARQTTDAFENFYELDGTKLQAFPLPDALPRSTAARLDRLATDLAASSPSAIAESGVPTADRLRAARDEWAATRQQMIGLQEQLDWEVYRLYGLVDADLTMPDGERPLELGQRAFEIVLARKMAAGEVSTTWFERHRSTPITELPAQWSSEYRALVERRIELIETDHNIGLIERPEYKRRWNTTPWEVQQNDALRGWLLDRLETSAYWPSAAITTIARLAAQARADADFMSVARLYVGRDDVDVAGLIRELVKGEAVPYLAALRYKPSGLRKWEQWCDTWALQRREDVGEKIDDIPVPPKYTSADFVPGVWTHRGKLDVPKERFVSYPGAESETDSSMVVGWAGWDHLERGRALATLYLQAKRDGRTAEQLAPMLAGLAELVPWLLHWYDQPNPDPALDRPGSQIRALLDSELRSLHLTADDLAAWRPPAPTRGRTKKTT
ncbi:MAG: BREX-2 system adenine-specific DNA-methyltransferase PglX [Desertimonas sp.]